MCACRIVSSSSRQSGGRIRSRKAGGQRDYHNCTEGMTQKYVRIALTAIRESDIFALCDQGQQHGCGQGSEIQYGWRPRKKYDACRRTAAGFLINSQPGVRRISQMWDERGITIWCFVRGTRTTHQQVAYNWDTLRVNTESLRSTPVNGTARNPNEPY